MMRHIFVMFLCSCLLVSGCTAETEILDDISLVTLVGYDLKGDKMQGTAVVPLYQADGSIINEHYTEVGELNKELGKKSNFQAPNPLTNGKIEVALFSLDFAANGVLETSDSFRRDPSVSSNLKFAVFDGNTEELIERFTPQNKDLGMYITNIIEHNIHKEAIPNTNIHLFFRAYFTEGHDPFLPYFTSEDGKPTLDGLALFKKDKAVGKIEEDELYLFTMLYNGLGKGNFTIQIPALDSQVSIGHINANREVKFKGDSASPQVSIDIELEGLINEYDGTVKGIEKKIKVIEKGVSKVLEKRAERMIRSLQEQKLDSLGIGKKANAHYRNWSEKQWYETYQDLDIKVNVKTNILESGVIR